MAAGNITILSNDGSVTTATRPYQTEAAATAILFGEPVKLKAAGSQFVIPLADAEPVVGTTTNVLGIASSDSTQTASANGEVDVFVPFEGAIYLANAKVAANIDTQSKYNALVGNNVLFDLTTGVYTVDESAVHATANGLTIVNLDIVEHPGQVAFTLRNSATYLS